MPAPSPFLWFDEPEHNPQTLLITPVRQWDSDRAFWQYMTSGNLIWGAKDCGRDKTGMSSRQPSCSGLSVHLAHFKDANFTKPDLFKTRSEAGELNRFCISPHSPSHKESFNDCLTKHTVVPAPHNHCHWKGLARLIKHISFGKQSFGMSCCLIRGLYWQWVYDHGF